MFLRQLLVSLNAALGPTVRQRAPAHPEQRDRRQQMFQAVAAQDGAHRIERRVEPGIERHRRHVNRQRDPSCMRVRVTRREQHHGNHGERQAAIDGGDIRPHVVLRQRLRRQPVQERAERQHEQNGERRDARARAKAVGNDGADERRRDKRHRQPVPEEPCVVGREVVVPRTESDEQGGRI